MTDDDLESQADTSVIDMHQDFALLLPGGLLLLVLHLHDLCSDVLAMSLFFRRVRGRRLRSRPCQATLRSTASEPARCAVRAGILGMCVSRTLAGSGNQRWRCAPAADPRSRTALSVDAAPPSYWKVAEQNQRFGEELPGGDLVVPSAVGNDQK